MRNNYHQSLLSLCHCLIFALLTGFVISIAYLSIQKPVSYDQLSANPNPEVTDYVRYFEDNADDDKLFVLPTSFNQVVQIDWPAIRNASAFKPGFTKVSYRARPRSPPVSSLI